LCILYYFIKSSQVFDGLSTSEYFEKASNPTTFQNAQEKIEHPNSLFDGVYDEDANARSFQDALEEWRNSAEKTGIKSSRRSVSGRYFENFYGRK